VAATVALGLLTWGLTVLSGDGGGLGGAGSAWAATALGVLGLGLFVAIEHRRGERAMMPLEMFASTSFAGLSILTFFLYAALGGLFVLLPFALIEAGGYSPLAAGAALLPLPAVIGLASRPMGTLAAKTGPRLPLTIGPLIVAAGFLLATRIGGESDYWTTVLPAVLVIAIGMAGAVAPLTTAVMASVDQDHVGVANGFNSALARTGGLIATALLGSVLAARGAGLDRAFDVAAFAAAGAATVAGVAALLLLRPEQVRTPP
jgi:predicted MFS family arabinose efflux permease